MDVDGLRPPEVGLGALTRWCPPALVDKVVEECGRRERRRRLLSARTVVYFELARCLYPREGYQQVFEELLPEDEDCVPSVRLPNKSSLCRARRKLGPQVLRELFHQVAGPVAEPETCPGAFWRGLRVEAFDGTLLDVADSAANAGDFGRAAGPSGPVGYPQARVLALVECGTHALIDAVIGGYRDSEAELAPGLAAATGAGTLVLADRGMIGVRLWCAFAGTGAELLWRLPRHIARTPVAQLGDGSYLACIAIDSKMRAAWRERGVDLPAQITVRVIEYTLDGSAEVYRLATSLLDPDAAPAAELAALYHERWESEGTFAEVKTVQRGPGTVLRSATPDGIRQEIWAHLTVHHLTRNLLQHAAVDRSDPPQDPDRISFRRAQHLVRRSLAQPLSPLRAKPGR